MIRSTVEKTEDKEDKKENQPKASNSENSNLKPPSETVFKRPFPLLKKQKTTVASNDFPLEWQALEDDIEDPDLPLTSTEFNLKPLNKRTDSLPSLQLHIEKRASSLPNSSLHEFIRQNGKKNRKFAVLPLQFVGTPNIDKNQRKRKGMD